VRITAISLLSLCVLAGVARAQDVANESEREFFNVDSPLPPQTLEGYRLAMVCNAANEVEEIVAKKAGDERLEHYRLLGSEKSYLVARRTADQLGLIESTQGPTDTLELKKMVHDQQYLRETIDRCRGVGLVYDGDGASTQQGPSDQPGPPQADAEARINAKFIQWSEGWAMDQYQPGSAHIDNMSCGDGGCEARGHFSFFRGGTHLTITFDAQLPRIGDNQYALRRLCYNDNTTGMRDCVQ
jgi:hypothetical protein